MIYRYEKKCKQHDRTVLKLYNHYEIEKIGIRTYQVYSIPYHCPICVISEKALNYSFRSID